MKLGPWDLMIAGALSFTPNQGTDAVYTPEWWDLFKNF